MEEQLYNDGIGKVQLVQNMGSDLTIVNAARVSFGVEKSALDERDKKLIRYLIKNKHTSTLEHNVITLKFTVPLFVARQHMRHRTWSFNEVSRRYTSEDIKLYEPKEFRTQHKSNRQASNDEFIDPVIAPRFIDTYVSCSEAVKKFHEHSIDLYNSLLDVGVCREQARGILPQNMYTEYYGTVNLNNLLKFIHLRLDSHAQLEIQNVASACLNIATGLWPETMAAWGEIKK